MSFTHITPGLWMLVPRDERQYLAEAFELSRTGVTEVRDDQVISDGYSINDLAALTAEAMAEFVGSEESFPRLWELTVAKARSELNPPTELVMPEPVTKPTHAKSTKKK